MGSRRRRRKTAQTPAIMTTGTQFHSSVVEEDVQAINTILLARLKAEQVSDRIACTAGTGPVLALHVVWFGAWVTVNAGAVRGHPCIRSVPVPDIARHLEVQTSVTPGAVARPNEKDGPPTTHGIGWRNSRSQTLQPCETNPASP